jgi:hypothetical protein
METEKLHHALYVIAAIVIFAKSWSDQIDAVFWSSFLSEPVFDEPLPATLDDYLA